ncbi:MAG: efflux RND transporter periplasmic adaptor subunit [Verrucomicrobiota bacterium]
MDIERPDLARKAQRKKRILAVAGTIVLAAIVVFLFQHDPGPIEVEKDTVWIGSVKQGSMLRQVRGIGTLTPKDVYWISARTNGRIERVHLLPGTMVEEDTILFDLSNPDLVQQTQNANLELLAAEANFTAYKVQLESDVLQLESTIAQLSADLEQNQLEAEITRELFKEGLESELNTKRADARVDQLNRRLELENKRLDSRKISIETQIAAREAQVDQSRSRYALLKEQLEGLTVRAGTTGVLQRVAVEAGQRVGPGNSLAQVVDPKSLKAVVKIPELQAKDVVIGQLADVDTRNGIVKGEVVRVDPNVSEGTVAVDIDMTETLPQGARPDLTVEGIIEIENLIDITYVKRPAYVRANSNTGIFTFLADDGDIAERRLVQFGRSSVNDIEVVNGLAAGDRIIISDTSEWEQHDKIKIN